MKIRKPRRILDREGDGTRGKGTARRQYATESIVQNPGSLRSCRVGDPHGPVEACVVVGEGGGECWRITQTGRLIERRGGR